MIIKDVRLTHANGLSTLSAACQIRKFGWDAVYFTVDSSKASYIKNDASPFAAALLLASMRRGEDLIIKGSISKQLFEGMQEIMCEVPVTWSKDLKKISIIADQVITDTEKPTKVASFFTGGVDSFYTYLKYKHDTVKSNRIDSFILVYGFDIHPDDTAVWDLTLKNIKAIAKAEGIELVVVSTNLHQLLEPILSWGEYNHGSCLAAVGLCLRSNYRKIYIPSSFTAEQQQYFAKNQLPIGSTCAVDKLWGSEHLSFVHDGAEATRQQKVTREVSKSAVALRYLRVCYINKDSTYNCGTCDKCMRTMVNLYVAGVLDKSKTFPHEFNTKLVAKIPTTHSYGAFFYEENLNSLQERGLNPDLQKAIRENMAKARTKQTNPGINIKKKLLHTPARKFVYLDHMYSGGYAYHLSAKLLGKRYYNFLTDVTECRPTTIRKIIPHTRTMKQSNTNHATPDMFSPRSTYNQVKSANRWLPHNVSMLE